MTPQIARPTHLLIVDDEAPLMNALCDTLAGEGYKTTGFTSPGEALEALRSLEFDLLLTDLMMPEMDGISLLRAAIEIDPALVAIVMTGHATVSTAVEALKAGALDYIYKPFKLSAVLPVLSRSLSVRRLRLENIQLRETVEIHGLSRAIATGIEFEGILDKLADTALKQTEAADLSILVPDPEGCQWRVAAIRGKTPLSHGDRISTGSEFRDWVERSRAFIAQPDANFLPGPPPWQPPVAADLSLPMLAGGKLQGIVNLTWTKPLHPATPGQIRALGILIGAVASALEASSLLEELRKAERRYRRLAENAPDIIFRYELNEPCGISLINARVLPVTGYEPADFEGDPQLIFRVIHADDRPQFEIALSGETPPAPMSALRWRHRNGALIWMEHHHSVVRDGAGRPVAIECIARDITERRNLEDQLRHSQKMEAVGRLAGGVAHDFNNLLTVIGGYSEHALSVLGEAHPLYPEVQQINRAGNRAAALTRQLLAFSRRETFQPTVFDLNARVKDMERMLRRLLGDDIELTTSLAPSLESIYADPGQIEQVVMNLVVNARDAMPDGGILSIRTANLAADRDRRGGVMLTVSDSGHGMDEAVRARIFEPFFTSKPQGKGTGLGLSIVYGIVQQSTGSIQVESELGKGTTFTICLPAVAKETGRSPDLHPDANPAGGSETVLVVEDEEDVRRLVCLTLQEAGYRVLAAASGEEALRRSESHGDRIDLLLTDLRMPGIGGTELAQCLAPERPGMKVLFMSGYADPSVDPPLNAFLQKPFTSTTLVARVREAIDEGKTRAPVSRNMAGGAGRLVLVVDDSEAVRSLIAAILANEGYVVRQASGVEQAWDILAAGEIRIVLSDFFLGGHVNGADFLRAVAQRHSDVRCILMSGSIGKGPKPELPFPLVSKPFKVSEIVALIEEPATGCSG